MLLVNTLLPYAGKMKYWDKNKREKSYYQNDPEKEKPGGKRDVGLKKEFILVLLRLKLGLLERHLADMFTVSVGAVRRIYMTWVRFLVLTFEGSLLRWPSKEEFKSTLTYLIRFQNTQVHASLSTALSSLSRSLPPQVRKRPLVVIANITTLLSY